MGPFIEVRLIRVVFVLRYIAFFNYTKNDKVIPNFVAGLFYRWEEEFTGLEYIRVGAGVAYLVDVKHVIDLSYFVGMNNTGSRTIYQGIPYIQLVINISKEYKYLPAEYFNF